MSESLDALVRRVGRMPVPEDQVPADERMDRAELRCVIEFLGLGQNDLARYLGVDSRTVRSWISGRYVIPDGVRCEVEGLEDLTAASVGELVDALQDVQGEPAVLVYETDEQMHAARPDSSRLPASWWRMVVMRAVCEVPGAVIMYAGEERE